MPSLAQKWIEQGMLIVQISDGNKLKEIFRFVLKIKSIDELENAHIWN